MAIASTNATAPARKPGQKLLIDTGRLTVRRIAKTESALLGALKSLGPVEKATLVALVDTLSTRKRKHKTVGAEGTS